VIPELEQANQRKVNNMLLGNVCHFISREMLDEYDWIPGIGPHDRKIVKNWGPFTLYQNDNKTNELFLQATNPLRELCDMQEPKYLDEWGEKVSRKVTLLELNNVRNHD
jgi:hypothetical protein